MRCDVIITLLKVFLALFIAFLIIVPLVSLIVYLGIFYYDYIIYKRIKGLYGVEKDWEETDLFSTEAYDNFIHVSFDKLLKFYNVSPDKYEVEENPHYGGFYHLTRTTKQKTPDSLYSYRKDIYYFIMDTFSDFLKCQNFCENIEKQRKQEEQRKEEQRDLEQSDLALGEYVKLVKADIAENEEQINNKIQELKDEIEKQKQMLKE